MSQILPLIKRLTQTARERSGDGRQEKFFVFRFGQKYFAIPAVDVTEVAMPCSMIEIPQKSDLIMGVVNMRGVVIPVINLRQRIAVAPDYQINDDSRMLLFSLKAGSYVGMIADDIEYRLREGIIEPPAPGTEDIHEKSFRVAVIENQRMPVFMIDAWLEKSEIDALQNVLESF
ncbi:MAG: hypothetical protein EOM80_07255 [Erysipelotrichia bacterium]|nr:hypothetical protein [Erysipelotrichia bacterium]